MNKKILLISHQLTRTGAPMVLLDMIRCYLAAGNSPVVISLSDGSLKDDLEKMGVHVIIIPQLSAAEDSLIGLFAGFDLIVVNTLVCHEAIPICEKCGKPTLWWIHEHEGYFEYYKNSLPEPDSIRENIFIFGVSPVTRELIMKAGYSEVGLLPFGVRDYRKEFEIFPRNVRHSKHDKTRFLCVGLFAYVKGQDILCRAINKLPADIMEDCEFWFYGDHDETDPAVYDPILNLSMEYDNVHDMDSVSHDEMMRIMSGMDYIVIPSRKEPMSAVSVEGQVFGIPSIVSDTCGVTSYYKNGSDALVFPSEDINALKELLIYASEMTEYEYKNLSENARRVYEKHFSMDTFARNILEML